MSFIVVILAMMGESEYIPPPAPEVDEFLLKEDGSFFLLESGDKLMLE